MTIKECKKKIDESEELLRKEIFKKKRGKLIKMIYYYRGYLQALLDRGEEE